MKESSLTLNLSKKESVVEICDPIALRPASYILTSQNLIPTSNKKKSWLYIYSFFGLNQIRTLLSSPKERKEKT